MKRLLPALLILAVACEGMSRSAAPTPQATRASFVPSGPCVRISAGADIQGAIDAHPSGSSFCLAAGTYTITSPLKPKNGDRLLGYPGATLTGNDRTRYAVRSSATDVTVRGLIVEHFNSPLQDGAIQKDGGGGWLIADNDIRYNAASGVFWKGDDDRLINNILHHNGQEGFSCSYTTDSLLDRNEIAFNNTRHISYNWEAGGGKAWSSTRLTISNNYVHDNFGPGLWTDTNNIHVIYVGNRVENNRGPGIFHEVSYDAVIRDNMLVNNGNNGKWLGPAGIWIANSSNVEVFGNTLSGNGIFGVEQDRGAGTHGPWLLRNVRVHGNRVTVGNGLAAGMAQDNHDTQIYDGSNAFEENVYTTPVGCSCWTWRDQDLTRQQWTMAGQD